MTEENPAAEKKKESFPRDSSATLGMTHSFFCHVEQAKRRPFILRKRCPRCVMLSLSKHLAEALLEKRHCLALAAQKLSNNNNPCRGEEERIVSTRFLGYARNDRKIKPRRGEEGKILKRRCNAQCRTYKPQPTKK